MFKCCENAKSICEELDCKVTETPKGFQIEVNAKDEAKTDSWKALVKAFHNFCGCR